MKKSFVAPVVVALLAISTGGHAASMRDMLQKATGYDNCRDDDQACKNRAILKGAAVAVAVGVAAKLIYDMVIEAKSEEVNNEAAVIDEYTKAHKTLPSEPVANEYMVSALPGNVVKPGSDVKMHSQMAVVPGVAKKEMLVEERITIYDNEDHSKPLRVTSKTINEGTKRGGRFTNEFSFTFPEGMPQGVYPIGTEVLIDGKPAQAVTTDMQLVLVVDSIGNTRMASLSAASGYL